MTPGAQNTNNTERRKPALLAFDALLAFFLAFSLAAETLMPYTGDIRSLYPANFIAEPTLATYALFAVAFAVLFALLRLLRKRLSPGAHARATHGWVQPECGLWAYHRSHLREFLTVMGIISIAWIALLLQFWPGTSMNDQLSIIAQPIVSGGTHPLLYNLALSLCVRVSLALFGTGNAGFATFIILQMLVCAGVVSFCCQWFDYRGVRRLVIILVAAFFALVPIVATFSINAWKDTLFSYAMLLWLPFTWEACANPRVFWANRKNYLVLSALVVATALLRNNGLMLALAFCVVLILVQRKSMNLKLGSASLAAALVICLLPSMALSAVGVHQITREVVGIPLQQLSAVQLNGNGELSAEPREYLDELLPATSVAGSYMPVFADGIKFMGWFDPNYRLDQTRSEFARAYADAALAYPALMLRAYLSHTYGNWSLFAFSPEQSYELALSANIPGGEFAQLMEDYGLSNQSFYPQGVQEWFAQTYPKLLVFPGPGACFALVLLFGYALTIKTRRTWPLLLVLPHVLLWCTLMLASPLSLALRYVFPMVCAIPFLAASLALPRLQK